MSNLCVIEGRLIVMKCTQCGKDNAENTKYCFYCGTPLLDGLSINTNNASITKKHVHSKKNNRKIVFMIISIILSICIISCVLAFLLNFSIVPKNADVLYDDYSDVIITELNYDEVDKTLIICNENEFSELKMNLDNMNKTQVIAANCFFTKMDNDFLITYDKKNYIPVIFSEKTRIANLLDKNVDLVLFITRVKDKTEVVLVYENGYDAFLSNYNETIEYYSQDVVGKTAKIVNTTVNYIPDNDSYWIYLPNGEVGFGIVSTEMDLQEFAGKTIDCKFVNVDSLPEGLTSIEYDTFWNVYSIDKVY